MFVQEYNNKLLKQEKYLTTTGKDIKQLVNMSKKGHIGGHIS